MKRLEWPTATFNPPAALVAKWPMRSQSNMLGKLEVSRGHPYQMTELSQLAPLEVERQWFYPESRLDNWTSISKESPATPATLIWIASICSLVFLAEGRKVDWLADQLLRHHNGLAQHQQYCEPSVKFTIIFSLKTTKYLNSSSQLLHTEITAQIRQQDHIVCKTHQPPLPGYTEKFCP